MRFKLVILVFIISIVSCKSYTTQYRDYSLEHPLDTSYDFVLELDIYGENENHIYRVWENNAVLEGQHLTFNKGRRRPTVQTINCTGKCVDSLKMLYDSAYYKPRIINDINPKFELPYPDSFDYRYLVAIKKEGNILRYNGFLDAYDSTENIYNSLVTYIRKEITWQ